MITQTASFYSLVLGNPSCLQATLASTAPQKSSQTVPQTLLLQISTRPCVVVPPRSLMAPLVQVATCTSHSSIFNVYTVVRVPSALAGQSMSLVSVPRH